MLDIDNIMKIEYHIIRGQITIEMVALFNKNKVSENEVNNIIESDIYSENIIIMTKQQFYNIFF